MSTHTMHQIPALLGLVVILALALTTSGAPLAAQQAVIGLQSPPAATGDAFRSSPVMFIENAGQWPEAARFQVWGGTAGTMWLAEDTTPANPAVSLVEETPDGCMKLTPVNASDKAPQKDGYQMIQCPYLSSGSIVGGLPSAIDDVPPAPVLISPDNQSRLDTLIPVLRVDTTISGVETSVRYEYSVNADLSPGAGGMGVAGPSTRREWSFPLGSGFAGYNLQPNTRYYWHARTGYGNWQGSVSWGPYSPTWSFTTGSDGTILPGPELVSPPNNSDVYTLRPALQWRTLPGARGFVVSASPVGGGSGYGWYFEDWSSESVQFWTDLLQNSSWDWKVRLRNDYAWGDLSSVWRFTVRLATISGRVTDASGHGIPGVTVWADSTHSTTTNVNGDYTFTGLPAGTYSVRPSLTPYAFSPASRTVTVPPNATGVDFQAVAITKIQVNQVLGNTTNYVAGKDTAVRVFMSDAVPFDPDHQQLQIYRDGNLITQTPLEPRKFSGRSEVLDFLCDRAECDAWQKGFYTFEAMANGDYLSQSSAEFKERRKLRILALPVRVEVGGQTYTPFPDLVQTAGQFTSKVFPVAADGIEWVTGPEFNARDIQFSVAIGFDNLFTALENEQVWWCRAPWYLGKGCFDYIVGVLPAVESCSPTDQCLPPNNPGKADLNYISIVANQTPNLKQIVAHEIGHHIGFAKRTGTGGLGDEYGKPESYPNQCGAFRCNTNDPPATSCGKDGFGTCSACFRCTGSRAVCWKRCEDGYGSTVTALADQPFDLSPTGRSPGPLPDCLSFMGAAGEDLEQYWVTPSAYDYMFQNLVPTQPIRAAAQSEERVAAVSGWIRSDGSVRLAPAYHFLLATPPVSEGSYTVEFLSDRGTSIANQGFDVLFTDISDPPQPLMNARFAVLMGFPTEARTLRVKRGSTVLAEMTISAYAPALSLISPTAGQTWAATGNYTIRWQGSDLDGDALHYTVLYRQGAGDWIVLGTDLTTDELTVDAAGLPGGTAAQVQVLASDGINTTAVESGLFTVGRKGPEAFITYPAEGASFLPGASFFLRGTAYDLEDGVLPDSAYRWSSNRDGDLGTGASNLLILSPGPHIITLTVTDSDGNTAIKTIHLSAGDRVFLPLIWRAR